MKKVALLSLLFLLVVPVYGQDFSYPVNSTSKDLTVHIRVGFTELRVKGSKENSIQITSYKERKNEDMRAIGLNPITPWQDNTGLGMHISEDGNEINVIKTTERSYAKYEITVPDWAIIKIEESEWGRGGFRVSGIENDVFIESNSSDISLIGISGSIHSESTSGNMIIELPESGQSKSHEISSVSGLINLQIEQESGYRFDLSTVSGSIHTDFDLSREIQYKGSTLKRISKPKEVETDFKGGGDLVEVSTVSGFIDINYKE